jgi:hypothetical protein
VTSSNEDNRASLSFFITFFLPSFLPSLAWPLLRTHCRLALIAPIDAYTLGRTPLDKGSARRWDLYLTTHTTQKRHIHVTAAIRTRNPSTPATADLRLTARSNRDRLHYIWASKLFIVVTEVIGYLQFMTENCYQVLIYCARIILGRLTRQGRWTESCFMFLSSFNKFVLSSFLSFVHSFHTHFSNHWFTFFPVSGAYKFSNCCPYSSA